jgi:trimeric autotransporter adhesin
MRGTWRWMLRLGVATCAVAACAVGVARAALPAAAPAPEGTCQTDGIVRSIAYSGSVAYLGGNFTHVRPAGVALGGAGTVVRNHLAACDEVTGKVLPWNPGTDGQVFTLQLSGTRIYVGGKFTTLAGRPRKNIGAVTTSGTATAFNPGASDTVYVIRLGPDGHLYAGGLFGSIGGGSHRRIAQLTTAGTATAWNVTVGQVTGFACPPRCPPVVYTIAFQGSTVYFGGQFGLVNGVARNTAAAVSMSNGHLLAWNPNIFAAANCPSCPTVETSRAYTIIPHKTNIFVCGGYWKVNGTKQRFNIADFDPTSGVVNPGFTIQDDGDTPGCAIRNGILYAGGHFNYGGAGCTPNTRSTNCSVRHHVLAADTRTNTLLPWNPNANSNHGVYTISADRTNVGFGGYFDHFGGRAQQAFAQYRNLP